MTINFKEDMNQKNLITLEEFKEKNYGKRGTKTRDELEAGYEVFKIGVLSSLVSGYDNQTPHHVIPENSPENDDPI